MSIKVPLSKPLLTHKGNVNELELNEPSAGSFFDHGEPFKMKVTGKTLDDLEYNNKAMLGFLADMSGIDQLLLKSLTGGDYILARNSAVLLIMGVVGENPTEA